MTKASRLVGVCLNAITTRDPCIARTGTSASTCISIQPRKSLRAHTMREASVRSDLAAVRSTFANPSASSILPASAPTGDSARKARIRDGRKICRDRQSRWNGVRRSSRKRGKESERRAKERTRGNGRDERETGGMGEGGERADTANEDGAGMTGNMWRRTVKGHYGR